MMAILDQVSLVGVQLVIRSILKDFPFRVLHNTPQHSYIPTNLKYKVTEVEFLRLRSHEQSWLQRNSIAKKGVDGGE